MFLSFYKSQLGSFVAAESDDDKIVGGSEVTPHAYPFTAAITLEGLCCCGGSILGMIQTQTHNICSNLQFLTALPFYFMSRISLSLREGRMYLCYIENVANFFQMKTTY